MQVHVVQLLVAYPIATGRFQDTYMHKVQHRGDVARYVSQLRHGTPGSIQSLVHWEVQRLPVYLVTCKYLLGTAGTCSTLSVIELNAFGQLPL